LEYDAEVIMALQLFDGTEAGQFGWICIAKNRSGGASGNLACRYDGMSGRFFDAEPEDVYAALAAEREGKKSSSDKEIADKLRNRIKSALYTSTDKLIEDADVPRDRGRLVLMQLMEKGEVGRENFKKAFQLIGDKNGEDRD